MQVSSIVSPLSTFAFLHITWESNGYDNYVISSDIRSKHIAVLLISFTAKGPVMYVTFWKIRILWNFMSSSSEHSVAFSMTWT